MTASYVAAPNGVFQVGFLLAALGVPTVGWILLVLGWKQRSQSRPQSGVRRPQHPKPAAERPSGTKLIVMGAALMALGVLVIVGRLISAG